MSIIIISVMPWKCAVWLSGRQSAINVEKGHANCFFASIEESIARMIICDHSINFLSSIRFVLLENFQCMQCMLIFLRRTRVYVYHIMVIYYGEYVPIIHCNHQSHPKSSFRPSSSPPPPPPQSHIRIKTC